MSPSQQTILMTGMRNRIMLSFRTRGRGAAAAVTTFLAMLALVVLTSSARAQEEEDGIIEKIDTTRGVLEKWHDTQRIISKERKDWALKQELMRARKEVLMDEIARIKERILEKDAEIKETQAQIDERAAEKAKLDSAQSKLRAALDGIEKRTRELLPRLPDPIRERVKPLSQQIPEDSKAETKLTIGQRYQNVIGVLNGINKFNREIIVTSEVRELADGKSAEVSALYIGIGQAFYVNGNGTKAGRSVATSEGWGWEERNSAAPQIAKAIAIMNSEAPAEFVELPVKID